MRYHEEIFSTPAGAVRTREETETLKTLALKDELSSNISSLAIVAVAAAIILFVFSIPIGAVAAFIMVVVDVPYRLIKSFREYSRDIAFIEDTEGSVNLSDDASRWSQVQQILDETCQEYGINDPPDIAISGWKFDYEIVLRSHEIVFGTSVLSYDMPLTQDLIRKSAQQYVKMLKRKENKPMR